MQLYNTLTGRKEEFQPADPGRPTMYVCGPTVYSHPHIGNARPAVVFDVLFRLLMQRYGDVAYVRNVTDIDDKIMAAARRGGRHRGGRRALRRRLPRGHGGAERAAATGGAVRDRARAADDRDDPAPACGACP